jgi:predicted HTH domain antitoxin
MAQDYDKIFKENIEEIILPLAKKVLNIDPEGLEEIPDDLQYTIERKPDFLKKVIHKDSTKDYVLHIEFQVVDEPKMVYRMLEYYALLFRDYKIENKQYVFYIGSGKAKMPTQVSHKKLQFSFEVINMQEIDYHQFINSSKPEEVILAILADFGKDKPQTVIDAILEKILIVTKPNLQQQKIVRQLEIISKLRKLQAKVIKSLNIMALTYDIKNDIRYKEGKEEGLSIAIENLLAANISQKQIAEYLKVSLERVQKVAKTMKK